jgi:hypothetical protein
MTFNEALRIKQKLIETGYHIKNNCDIWVTPSRQDDMSKYKNALNTANSNMNDQSAILFSSDGSFSVHSFDYYMGVMLFQDITQHGLRLLPNDSQNPAQI